MVVVRACVILISSFLIGSCSNQETPLPIVNITLAAEMSLLPATVWIAENKGFFDKHSVNLTIKEFDSGRNALESMLKTSDIDIATVAQTPVVFNSFNNEPYVIVATMAYSIDDIKVLARKDKGIETAKDLKGKKIGATKRSTGHYFLEGFLTHYGYTLDDISLQDINASTLKTKLQSGEVDAITTWEPHIYNSKQEMGEDKLASFISPTPFRKDFYFTVSKKYAKNNIQDLQQFLSALVEAEAYIHSNPKESQLIIADRLGVNIDIVKLIWDSFIFEISLEQSILVSLEDEAIWASTLENKKLNIPNYLDYVDINPLLKVKPNGVHIFH